MKLICETYYTSSFGQGPRRPGDVGSGPTEPAGETARRPVDLGNAPTVAKRRPTLLRESCMRKFERLGFRQGALLPSGERLARTEPGGETDSTTVFVC